MAQGTSSSSSIVETHTQPIQPKPHQQSVTKCLFSKNTSPNNVASVTNYTKLHSNSKMYLKNNQSVANVGFIGGKSSIFGDTQVQQQVQKNSNNNGGNMVAANELNNVNENTCNNNNKFDDTNEELIYGPGIVSKLRCRYLSLALRQSVNKQRPSIDNLRRATSLNNLLDDDGDDDRDEYDAADGASKKSWNSHKVNSKFGSVTEGFVHKFVDKITNNLPAKKPSKNESRCRQTQRGNDSLKRARSVEALMR